MTSKNDSPVSRGQTSYQKLTAAAANLNALSDQLGKVIVELDAALKSLNLGITTWVPFSTGDDGSEWASDDIGYAKVDGKWGIAIRSISGDYNYPEGIKTDGEWLFNDAPRVLRLGAIDKIPDLLEKLVKDVATITERVDKKLNQSLELWTAIDAVAKGTDKPPKETHEFPSPPNLEDLLGGRTKK
jgi:hypothetical protein